jgi:hypothetical protein
MLLSCSIPTSANGAILLLAREDGRFLLPQELRLKQITTLEEANRFLQESYIDEFNRKFARTR